MIIYLFFYLYLYDGSSPAHRLLWLWPLTHPATLGTSTRRPEVGSDRVETRPFISSRLGEGHTRLGRCVDTSSPFVLFVLFCFFFLLTLFGTSSRHRHRPRPPSRPPQLSGEKKGTLGSSCHQKLAKWYLNEMPRPRRGVRRPRGRSWRPRSGLGGAAASRVQRSFLISVMNMY